MKQPTHFIEVYKIIHSGEVCNGPICNADILFLMESTDSLETIAIWKIYPKPQSSVFVAHYDNDLKATIIQ